MVKLINYRGQIEQTTLDVFERQISSYLNDITDTSLDKSIRDYLFVGPPGAVEHFAEDILKKSKRSTLRCSEGHDWSKPFSLGHLAGRVTNLGEHDVLIVDLADGLEEVGYVLLEAAHKQKLSITIGEGDAARSVDLDLPQISLLCYSYSPRIADKLIKKLKFLNLISVPALSQTGISIPIGFLENHDDAKLSEFEFTSPTASYLPIIFKLSENTLDFNCLVGGGIGSGKTNFLHQLICSGAELYAPSQLQFLLIDLNEGAEFSVYKSLPHAYALATTNDTAYAVSVLRHIKKEIVSRGERFKKHGSRNISSFRSLACEVMPRWIVVIDEFQRLLSHPELSREVSPLLDDLVRTGRSYGIHFVLSTQSIDGVDVAETTLMNLSSRVIFHVPNKDAVRFLDNTNTKPSEFKFAGMAVYNTDHGRLTGNQIVRITECDDIRIQDVIKFARSTYGESNVQTTSYGDAFAPYFPSLLDSKQAPGMLIFTPGMSLDFETESVRIEISTHLPERFLVVGSSIEKWMAWLTTFLSQVARQTESYSIKICDFSESLKKNPLFSAKCSDNIVVADSDASITLLLKELLQSRREGVNKNCSEFLIFFDVGNARMLRRKIFDPVSRAESEPEAKIMAIDLLLFGPSHGIAVSAFCRKTSQLLEVFQLGNETPVRTNLFEYQMYCDSSDEEYPGADRLGDFSARLADKLKGSATNFIMFNGEQNAV
jgi:hypothetical protein